MEVLAEIYGIMYIFLRSCLEVFSQKSFVKSIAKPIEMTLTLVFFCEFWEIFNEEHVFQKPTAFE